MLRQGLFYPDLTLGAGALSAARRTELAEFLGAVVRQRALPLHLANLWNALYFRYDLDHSGFRVDHIEQKRIPTRTAALRQRSLPIGGFVRIHTEMKCGDLLAEVIYKEGAHPGVGADWLDPTLSGAPATVAEDVDGERVAIVRERFVLDISAFGPDANAVTDKQYERLCRKARWLDEHGHLVLEAMYAPRDAELDDIDYYADYLLREHREGLLAFCFTEDLPDPELREALLRSFEAVRAIALSTRDLLSWRDNYFFAAEEYKRRLASNGALGGGDLQALYKGLVHVPGGDDRAYSAVGPRLLELLARNVGGAGDDSVLVRGSAYASAVCDANLFVAEAFAHQQRHGLLPTSATIERPTHLRLDDGWQSGGIWRTEQVRDTERYSLAAIPHTIPLGLGFAEGSGGAAIPEMVAEDEQPVPSSQTGFRVSLTLRDRALGRLRLSAEAAGALAPGPVQVVLRHEDTRQAFDVERDGRTLYGVHYSWDLPPGIVLSCNVESGGSVVRARTTLRTPPIVASDGARFDYDTNVAVYERAMRLRQLSSAGRREAPTLRELCNRAFRTCGRLRDDGARALTVSELAAVILGPAWRPDELRPIARALEEMDLQHEGAYYFWRSRVGGRARASDRSLLAAYGETKAVGGIARTVRRHWVPMNLRRYTRRAPSAHKRATYAEARMRYGEQGRLPEELPPGCTWVEPYSWGGHEEPEPTDAELAPPLESRGDALGAAVFSEHDQDK